MRSLYVSTLRAVLLLRGACTISALNLGHRRGCRSSSSYVYRRGCVCRPHRFTLVRSSAWDAIKKRVKPRRESVSRSVSVFEKRRRARYADPSFGPTSTSTALSRGETPSSPPPPPVALRYSPRNRRLLRPSHANSVVPSKCEYGKSAIPPSA